MIDEEDESSADVMTDHDSHGSARVQTVIVTGSAGFIGSHICDVFLAAGFRVIGIDNHSSGVQLTPEDAELRKLDLAANVRSGDLKDADIIVHAAAYPELRHNWDSREQRDKLYRNNVEATINLLEKMPEKVPLIFLSSASVYGSAHSETDIVGEGRATSSTQESPYSASKMMCEALIAAYSYKTQRPWHVLRLVNVVGARGHRGVIADFVGMMKHTGKIHAADDGVQRKSWVHVLDVAGAVLKIAQEHCGDIPSGVYNVTSQERVSWWDIVKAMNVPYNKITHEERDRGAVGDPWNLYASGAKLAPWYRCDRSIASGIREALKHLGWP